MALAHVKVFFEIGLRVAGAIGSLEALVAVHGEKALLIWLIGSLVFLCLCAMTGSVVHFIEFASILLNSHDFLLVGAL